ncbi:hypothetical protein OUZ56_032072 [Daphnia magna]|uniref:Uncharacterized protein n=1 Tax=Daphnia magna TaxID=35525 RepID=A0ABQ9ZW25_9CRUS|nr:hypothetical protein OUZ56_032072 [Daphnia magna]
MKHLSETEQMVVRMFLAKGAINKKNDKKGQGMRYEPFLVTMAKCLQEYAKKSDITVKDLKESIKDKFLDELSTRYVDKMLAGTADFTTNLMIYDLCGYLVKTRKTLTDCVDCKSAIQCEELDLPECFVADKYIAMRNRGGLTFVTTPFFHTMCAFEEVIASHFKDLNHIYIMRANEDSGLETTSERRSVRKGPLIQRFVRSVRERFTPLRSGGGSTSILRNNENLGVELDSDSPHQSDIELLDSNEIKELRNDDQWNEVLNMQVSSQDETVVELLIGEETRELLSYNQLLKQARAITDLEKTTDRVENTEDISIDFQNLELVNEENQDRAWFYQQYGNTRITEIPVDDLIFELQYLLRSGKKIELTNKEVGTALTALLLTEPTILTPIELFKHCGLKTYYEITLETEEESSKNSVPIKIVRAEIHTQGDQIPLDCSKSTPSTTTITCPAVTHSQSSMNTQIPQSQLASTPCNYLPYQGLQSRKVSFTPASIVEQSNKIMQNKPSKEKNQDMPIKIYVKELSRLMESGMDYEDASKAADCIVQHVLTNTKRCINSSQKTKPNGQPVFRTSSQPSYLTSTPLHTQPLALSGQSVKIPSMYNKQSNNGATPKYSVISSIPKMNPLVMCPSKVNSIGNTNNFISNAIDKNKKLQQSQAMTLFSNVGIYVDRERSGRFDDWLAHLESVLVLGDFEESRKIILLRSKLYGEAADEFDNFKLENPISAQIYDRVKERLIKLFHSTETRSKQSVEFHNMQREPEENMRRYANRIRKAFHLAYPIKSTIDKATAFSREQIMMDRFLEGLSFDVQTRLK